MTMRIAILSPHRDDAAFSCGLTMQALLQADADLTVINVFTHSDYAVDLQTIDPALPLVDAVSQARRLEDESFIADIARSAKREPESVQLHDLNLLDAPLRLAVRTEEVLQSPLTAAEVQEQAAALAAKIVDVQTFDFVFAPLALGDHIDHRIVREAAKACVAPNRLCLYEDLPYAARLAPAQRKHETVDATSLKPFTDFVQYTLHLADGSHLRKRFAMHYPSQIAPEVADEMAIYAAQLASADVGAERWMAMPATGTLIRSLLRRVPVLCSLAEEQQ